MPSIGIKTSSSMIVVLNSSRQRYNTLAITSKDRQKIALSCIPVYDQDIPTAQNLQIELSKVFFRWIEGMDNNYRDTNEWYPPDVWDVKEVFDKNYNSTGRSEVGIFCIGSILRYIFTIQLDPPYNIAPYPAYSTQDNISFDRFAKLAKKSDRILDPDFTYRDHINAITSSLLRDEVFTAATDLGRVENFGIGVFKYRGQWDWHAPHPAPFSTTLNHFELSADYLDARIIDPFDDQNTVSQTVQASTWTGILTVTEQAKLIKASLPSAIQIVDSLIASYSSNGDLSGHNGGPPMEDRDAALDALSTLHRQLGEILLAAEKEGDALLGQGFLVDTIQTVRHIKNTLKQNAAAYGIAGMLEYIFWTYGVPGGSIAADLAIQSGRRRVPD